MENTEKAEPMMMLGTNGYHDYLVIAGKGDVALGIKPNSIKSGAAFGHPGTVWFGARLRSARIDGQPYTPSESSGAFQQNPENLWDAWPGVVWEKQDDKRASTTIGVLLRGTLEGSIEEAQALLDKMKSGKLSEQMAEYLSDLAGAENLITQPDEIAAWLTANVYGKIAAGLEKQIEARKIMEVEMEKNIGTFGMQAQILKKAYDKLAEPVEDLPDAEGDSASDD
jgi:hypothetical protein